MTKSKMRIYKGRGYSDHAAYLHIVTLYEEITLPVHDILEAITDD